MDLIVSYITLPLLLIKNCMAYNIIKKLHTPLKRSYFTIKKAQKERLHNVLTSQHNSIRTDTSANAKTKDISSITIE
jgi:hypothetical protein